MTDERKKELYAKLIKEVEARTAKGQTVSRFNALDVLDEWGVELNRDSVDLVEKLYADGFVSE